MKDGERAKSRTHPFWGTSCVSCLNVDAFALPGAVPLVGELRAPRYQGPLGCLPGRRRGGPWAPPPRDAQIPGDVNGFFFHVVVLVLFSACLSWVIRLSGWDFVWEFSPSRLDPLLVLLFVSLFFNVCCVRRRRFSLSLSLSLSQALGKPKPPSRGFGVPLVFLRPDRDHVPRPVLQAPQLHPGHLPHLFFFFFVRRSRWVVVGLLLGVWFSGWWVLGRSVFRLGVLVGIGPAFAALLHLACIVCTRKTATPVVRPQWRLAPFLLQIGSSRVTRLLLGVDPGTVRSAAGRGCGRHCDPTTC